MASKILTIAALFMAAVSASPATARSTGTIPAGTPFTLMALRSASGVHFQSFQAAHSSIFAGLPSQNASCDAGVVSPAVFTLTEAGELFLYTRNPPQELFADRSGMGQGKIGYVTGVQPLGPHFETTGWTLDSANDLTLHGAGLIACPNSIDGAWSIWVAAGVDNPAGNTDCLGISARAVVDTAPVYCEYTQL